MRFGKLAKNLNKGEYLPDICPNLICRETIDTATQAVLNELSTLPGMAAFNKNEIIPIHSPGTGPDGGDETRFVLPKGWTRALSDAAKLLPDAAPPHLRDDFTIQQLQRLAEAFAANEVAGYQRQ